MKIRKASSRSSVTSLDRENIILVLCNTILSHFIELKISLCRPIEVQVEASRISRESAHEGGKIVSPTHRLPLPLREDAWYSFLLQTESTSMS